ncbi:PEP-CTERM sorting domain-containing protein [Brumicola pallidula]|uniref:PEP-CTERM protein-sorting domain-containing protein n=1 Tax=Brumicola pallidula DSM 14239 = ACAM 615 TaxID=1121922 RepID=K6YAB2_9ALTE|nr:PEP-CTERM sorting domain-containing protein [Glaciecola pallidula]GAC29689.1 hypothetical protein GPAL_2838 [Glaciecola pallidula DSM 14239 = ACAM 615]
MNRIIKTLLAVTALVLAGTASATLIVSGAGNGVCTTNQYTSTCTLVNITPHSAWQTNNPFGNGAVWVSSLDSGIGGITIPSSNTTPYMTITEMFWGNAFSLDIWADDTASVYVDGLLVISENLSQGTCAIGSIGCEPNENGSVSGSWGVNAWHTVRIDVYQTGGSVAGALYSGSYNVPVSGSLALLGLGLVGLMISRKKKA